MVDTKFIDRTAQVLPHEQAEGLLALLRDLKNVQSIRDLSAAMQQAATRPRQLA